MNVSLADVAGAIARLTLDKDPRRFDGESVQLVVAEWHRALDGYPSAALGSAVDSLLADSEQRFPNVAEVVNATAAAARREVRRQAAIARGRESALPGLDGQCADCSGERIVWSRRVIPEKRDETGAIIRPEYPVDEVAPCPACRPDDHQYQMDGHLSHDDDALLACDHPRCRRRAESKPLARRRAAK